MKRVSAFFVVIVAGMTVALVGCSKKEPEAPPTPPLPPIALDQGKLPPPRVVPSASATNIPPASATPTAAAEEETPAQVAAQVKQLETDYRAATDFQKKVIIIYDLSSTESPETVDALGRMFLGEKDQELKVELISSLGDVEGYNDKKMAVLNSGLRADQPKEVRLQAIDTLSDLEDKRAIQVLQVYANDPDEEVRDAIKDAVDTLQNPVPATPQIFNGVAPAAK